MSQLVKKVKIHKRTCMVIRCRIISWDSNGSLPNCIFVFIHNSSLSFQPQLLIKICIKCLAFCVQLQHLISDMRLNFACLIQTLVRSLKSDFDSWLKKETLKNLCSFSFSIVPNSKCRKYGAKSLISILLLSKVTHVGKS